MSVKSLLETRHAWLLFTFLVCALSWIFFGSLANHLLDSHDIETFRDNVSISEDFSFFFSADKEHPSLRPADIFFKWLAFLVWGNDPVWFHFFAIGMHGLNTILLSYLFRSMGLSMELSMIAGLLFFINVGHYEVIHWITALSYSIALAFGCGALICHIRFISLRRTTQILMFHGLLVIGLMAHPAIASLGLYSLYWSLHKGVRLSTALQWLTPSLLVFAIIMALLLPSELRQTNLLESFQLREGLNTIEVLMGSGRVLLWLLSRLVTTAHWLLVPMYNLSSWELWIGALGVGSLTALIWKTQSAGKFAAVWILLSSVPVVLIAEKVFLGYLPAGPPRYLYIPSAGSSLLLAWLIQSIDKRFSSSGKYVRALLLTIIVFSSYSSLKKAEALSLYTSSRSYHVNADFRNAASQLQRAINRGLDVLDQEDAQMRLCLMSMGVGEDSDVVVSNALEQFPLNSTLLFYKYAIESTSTDSNRRRLAAINLEAVLLDPSLIRESFVQVMVQAYHHIGRGFESTGDFGRAVDAYQMALSIAPHNQTILERLVISSTRSASSKRD